MTKNTSATALIRLQALAGTPLSGPQDLQFYPCEFTWNDSQLGELSGSTVITGIDPEAALNHFRSRHPHLTRAWIPLI